MQVKSYCRKNPNHTHESILSPAAAANRTVSYFYSNQLSTIYQFPIPNPATKVVVGVISFGGGLVGTVSAQGVLTNGDVQQHWTTLGIAPANHPQVILVPIDGATNAPVPSDGATIENTIDVETIGAMCPSPNLTIILFLAPNTLEGFTNLLTAASGPTVINGVSYTPNVISCSWGAPELYFPSSLTTSINAQLQTLASRGVIFTAATGDNGSSDGATGLNVDFPSSSPYALACGGTHLVCPNYTYDGQTVETAWSSGGGGVSVVFPKPDYQVGLSGITGRSTPDVSLVADPNTGVVYTIGGQLQVIGGTSIVSPALAAFFAIVNANQFANPLLYGYPSSDYHDITSGRNGAYRAKIGYDNCTGLGSIVGANLVSSFQGTIQVTGVSLSATTLDLIPGETIRVAAIVQPNNATSKSVTWSSSNTGIATVNGGAVTGVANGTATITVTTINGGFQATCAVTVGVAVTSVSISPTSLNLAVNQTELLTATVLPTNATDKTVTWSSSNTGIATVNGGLVTGVADGTAIITATSGGIQVTCTVTVGVPVTTVSVAPTSLSLGVNQNGTLTATVLPTDATNKTVTWSSSNTSIATVIPSGISTAVVIGKGNGPAIITANASGQTTTATVTVANPITSISLTPRTLAMTVNTTSQTTVLITPTSSSSPVTNWTSTNSAVATVNASGLVTAVGNGTATITASTGGKSASRNVTVTTPVTGITVSPSSVSIAKSASTTVLATVSPATASNKIVTWSSRNTSIAIVSNGVIYGGRSGTTTVTAVAGTYTATVSVTVR